MAVIELKTCYLVLFITYSTYFINTTKQTENNGVVVIVFYFFYKS